MTLRQSTTASDRPRLRPDPVTGGARIATRGLVFLFLILFVVFFLIPIVWLLLASTKTGAGLERSGPFSFGSLSALRSNWDHLMSFQGGAIKTWMTNSVFYSLAALVITLVVSVPAGYALAKMQFAGRRLLLVTTLVVMLMPAASLVLPTFLEVNYVSLVDTPLSVILPFSFFPFGVYLTYIYFSTAVSNDLLAAARLDGCGDFRAFRYIALPLASPIVALVGVLQLRRQLEQLLPAVRDAAQQRPLPDAGRVDPDAGVHPHLQPGGQR